MDENLRRWHLDGNSPYTLQLAADARLSRTDYVDDQVWELVLGAGDSPAVTLQTRYGGRVGLASLVPMWEHDGRSIYQAQALARPLVITAFAPGYARAEGRLTPEVVLTADFVVWESHAVGGRFTVHNHGAQPLRLRLDLFGHVGVGQKPLSLAVISLRDGGNALSLGRLPGLEPVVVMEQARTELVAGEKASPKIGLPLEILPGADAVVCWVHAGLARMETSLERAQFWLGQNWDEALSRIAQAAQTIPGIETGSDDQDAVIAFSYQQLMQAFLRPAGTLPYASFVASRQPDQGYSRSDGSDYGRGWNGQIPQLAYMVALGVAPVIPELAQGVVRNYLAVQRDDGWIDARPGPAGQRQGVLCPPLLARMTWEVYQYTGDAVFLAEVFPGLLKFFNRWCEVDLDFDGDILPEWQDERQTGYVFWPTFAAGQPWAQNLDVSCVEAPDMGAYLLSEAASLRDIAQVLGDPGAYEIDERVSGLHGLLDHLWHEPQQRYVYRDRDSHLTTAGVDIIREGGSEDEHLLALPLDPPARLLVRVSGGTGRAPRAVLHLEGEDAAGRKISETVDFKDFAWGYGSGVYTTRALYAVVDRVRFEGLSRVYRVDVRTVDLSRLDINAVMPLWSRSISTEHAQALIDLLTDEAHFWQSGGLTIVSASDENYDPSSASGGGGVWTYWLTLIGEGLVDHGRTDLAAAVLKRLLDTQAKVLRQSKRFYEFYHSDAPQGLGEAGFLSGIAPLHLLMCVLGVRIMGPERVWTGGPFVWGSPVTIRQHGVIIRRSEDASLVRFPSGHEVNLPAGADWQLVVDPDPATGSSGMLAAPATPPEGTPAGTMNRVIIQVEKDSDTDRSPQ